MIRKTLTILMTLSLTGFPVIANGCPQGVCGSPETSVLSISNNSCEGTHLFPSTEILSSERSCCCGGASDSFETASAERAPAVEISLEKPVPSGYQTSDPTAEEGNAARIAMTGPAGQRSSPTAPLYLINASFLI